MPKYTDPTTGKSFSSKEPLNEYELEEAFGAVGGKTEPQESTTQRVMKAAAPYVRPALEFGGMIAGGILGTPADVATGPAGTLLGAGLGYAGGRKMADVYEQAAGMKQPKDILTEVSETGKDIVAGVGMEAGGALLGKGINKATQYIAESNIPKRLYGSAIKAPLSKKWVEVLPGKEVSKRTQAIEAGLENKIVPSDYGAQKISILEKQARTTVDDIINAGTAKGDVFSTDDILNKGLQRAYAKAKNSSDPEGAKKIIDEIAEKFKAHGDTIPANKLNAIKRSIYDEVKWGGTEATALVSKFNTMSKKGIAHEAKAQLEAVYGEELAKLNKNDAAYIALKEAIERATARLENRDMIGLAAKVIGVRSIPGAIFEWTIGHPQIKSRLAFALHRAATTKGNMVAKPAAYAVGSAIRGERERPKLLD
jgi:hypothetical protein